jgi:tRNA (Guanine-1)-methyltransferase
VCIDLGFDDHQAQETATAASSSSGASRSNGQHDKTRRHSDKESRSLCKQLCLSYNVLKNAAQPVHLHVTSYDEQSFVGNMLKQQGGKQCAFEVHLCSVDILITVDAKIILFNWSIPTRYQCTNTYHKALNWKVTMHNQAPWELFPPDDIIILSPDATEVLDTIDPHKVYVIGGIVDRSVRKEETLSVARLQNLTAKRLPVQEYIPDRQSHILNIDCVLNAICVYQVERDWEKTLRTVMPLRRQVSGGKKMRKLGHKDDEVSEEPPVIADTEKSLW